MRLALLLALPAALTAQRDTTRAASLETVVVTAERTRLALGSSTAAVTRIAAAELALVPHATVADVLRRIPGFAIISFDGLGNDPQLMTRGFYGGGEAEYVVVMVDGIPVDQLQSGLVPWDALPPLSAIEAVEVVRGGSSALYGSSAIGGVINVITRRNKSAVRTEFSGGTHGSMRAAVDGSGSLGTRRLSFAAGLDRTDGFRAHAERATRRARGSLELAAGVTLTASSFWRDFDEPGALLESVADSTPRASDPIFRFDNTQDRSHSLVLGGARGVFRGALIAELRQTTAVRTIPLAPGFGDTKERDVRNGRLGATAQMELGGLTLGIDASYGSIDSKYYLVEEGERGALDAEGAGERTAAAVFAQYTLEPVDALRLSLGGRWDWLDDGFHGKDASHSAFSPKIGVNVRLSRTAHAYATVSRSFKAPTLDQLFDQRSIPVPFPPFSLTTSNALLEPQYGTNVEGGVYYGVGHLTTSLSLFQMDMKDELDFDVATLKYVNIGRSRHRGLELGARYEPRPGNAIFVAYTVQVAKARSGENAGKLLKAIPRRVRAGGFTVAPAPPLSISVSFTHPDGMFLDDANTREIFAYSRFDAQLSYAVRSAWRLTLEAMNLFDHPHNVTAFPDPAGGAEPFAYPGARRTFRVGIRHGW